MSLEELIEAATQSLEGLRFVPLDEGGGERHGAWEWTWIKARGKGHSYVSLIGFEAIDGTYRMQIWAGADSSTNFGRFLVREFPDVREGNLKENKWYIIKSLQDAAQRASNFSDETLTADYARTIGWNPKPQASESWSYNLFNARIPIK